MFENLLHRFTQPFINFGPMIPKLILGVVVGGLIIKIGLSALGKLLKIGRVPRSLIDIIQSLSAVILWIMLLGELAKAAGLSSIAVTISGSLVVLGFALANGATALTSDIIAAFFIAKDRDFNIGDRIKTGDVEGIVTKIDIRKVRVKTDDGKLFIVPNTNLDKNGWMLYAKDYQESSDKNEDKKEKKMKK